MDKAPSAPLSHKAAALWQTPCHLPELGLTARLQTGAWVGLNHKGGVWGTGEWASAPRPGCRHCSLSHRLVATALGTASLHNSLPTVTHTGRGARILSHAHLPATPLASPCAHSDWDSKTLPHVGPWAASGLGSGAWTPASVPRAAWKTPWRSSTELGFS